MWAQNWRGLQELMLPFPNKPSVDVTPNMIRKVFFLSIQLTKSSHNSKCKLIH